MEHDIHCMPCSYTNAVVDCWLVGCLGFNGPLRQYFSLYRSRIREKEK